jgi:osmotically-inducible protein OsmY
MKQTSVNTGRNLKVWGLALSLATVPLLLGVTGCASSGRGGHEQSTGQYIDDRATSSRVKDALSADPLYKFGGVNVETFKGTVQLSGFVTAREQKSRAGDLARRIEGVREIVNNITVKEPSATTTIAPVTNP